MSAHRIAAARNVPLLATVGDIPTCNHASGYRGQRREAFVDDVDALISARQLLEAAQSLASRNDIFGPATVGEVVVDLAELRHFQLARLAFATCWPFEDAQNAQISYARL